MDRGSVDDRVLELIEHIRLGVPSERTRNPSRFNEEQVEEFIRSLETHPGRSRLRVFPLSSDALRLLPP